MQKLKVKSQKSGKKYLIKIIIFSFCLFNYAFSSFAADGPSFQADVSYGKLTIYSDIPGSDIYVDAKYVGQDRAMISNIPTGKHYVRVVKDETTIQSGLVDVKDGEETIIVAKPAEEELLSRYKKQNLFHVYLSYSSLNHVVRKTGSPEITADLAPLIGLNFEAIFPVADFDFMTGFRFNLPAALSFNGTKLTELNLSSPYANISKKMADKLLGNRNLSLGVGAGFNYSYYSGDMISITGGLGYQVYAELAYKTENQYNLFRFGYLTNNGRGSNQNSYINSGYFITGGLIYKL